MVFWCLLTVAWTRRFLGDMFVEVLFGLRLSCEEPTAFCSLGFDAFLFYIANALSVGLNCNPLSLLFGSKNTLLLS